MPLMHMQIGADCNYILCITIRWKTSGRGACISRPVTLPLPRVFPALPAFPPLLGLGLKRVRQRAGELWLGKQRSCLAAWPLLSTNVWIITSNMARSLSLRYFASRPLFRLGVGVGDGDGVGGLIDLPTPCAEIWNFLNLKIVGLL